MEKIKVISIDHIKAILADTKPRTFIRDMANNLSVNEIEYRISYSRESGNFTVERQEASYRKTLAYEEFGQSGVGVAITCGCLYFTPADEGDGEVMFTFVVEFAGVGNDPEEVWREISENVSTEGVGEYRAVTKIEPGE